MTKQPRRAMVLFIVVVVIAMLSLSGFGFVSLMSTENKATHLRGDELQLEQVLASGVELIKAFVKQPADVRAELGGSYDNEQLFKHSVVIEGEAEKHAAAFSILSPRIEEGEMRGVRYGIENESARLNLGTVLEWERKRPGAGRRALLQLPNMTEPIADAILDWMDPDSTPREQGAEDDYYTEQGLPYLPRNAVPVSLEELLLVRGVTRDLLFGSDANGNYQVDPDEVMTASDRDDSTRMTTSLPWAAFLTVQSAEPNLTAEGLARINLNDADLAALHNRLLNAFDRQTADFVVAYRQYGPYQDTAAGSASRSSSRLSSRSSSTSTSTTLPAGLIVPSAVPSKATLVSVLDLVGARVQVPASNQGNDQNPGGGQGNTQNPAGNSGMGNMQNPTGAQSNPGDQGNQGGMQGPGGATGNATGNLGFQTPVNAQGSAQGQGAAQFSMQNPNGGQGNMIIAASPFSDRPGDMRQSLPKLLDLTTVNPSLVIRGRINVNTAPKAVLLCVPGMTEGAVDKILAARNPLTDQDPDDENAVDRSQPSWLVTEGIVTLPLFRSLLPYLTTGGSVYRAQVAAFFEGKGPILRAEVVIDATGSGPREVYWRNMRALGRGFTRDVLGDVSELQP